MECPNCKTANPEGAEFCLTCGWDLPGGQAKAAPKRRTRETGLSGSKCPHCGATNPEDATFCNLCNADLAPVRDAEAPPAASGPATKAPAPAAPPVPAPAPEAQAPEPPPQDQPPAETPPPAPAGDEEALNAELEELRRKAMGGKIKAEDFARMAEIELGRGKREEAARCLMNAIQMNPREKRYQLAYSKNFTERELNSWGLSKVPKPIWSDLPAILIYPVTNGEWLGLLLGAVFVAFLLFISRWAMFFGFVLALFALGFVAYQVGRHTKHAALGKFGHPDLGMIDFSYLWYAFCAIIATLWPFLAVMIVGFALQNQVLTPLLFLFALCVLLPLLSFMSPMCFLASMLYNSGGMAFHYLFIVKSIFKIFLEYLFAFILMLVINVGMNIAFVFLALALMVAAPGELAKLLMSMVVGFINTLFTLYFLTVYGHILGRLYYNNQKKLQWF